MNRHEAELLLQSWREQIKSVSFGNKMFRGYLVMKLMEAIDILLGDKKGKAWWDQEIYGE